jgi:hypothetical protein
VCPICLDCDLRSVLPCSLTGAPRCKCASVRIERLHLQTCVGVVGNGTAELNHGTLPYSTVYAQLTHQQLPPDAATKSMIAMPVYNAQRQVVAVVQAIGKKCPESTTTGTAVSTSTTDSSSSISTSGNETAAATAASSCAFSSADESALRALCSHISVDLENLKRAEFVDTDLEQTITLLKAHGKLSTLELPSG